MTSLDEKSNLPANVEKKELSAGSGLRSVLNSPAVKSRFEEMLGKRAPSFLSSVISAVSTNKSLSECAPNSVVSSAAVAASLDLPINPSLGFAHIVPYKGVAQFQMGWKGFVQLALRSGQYHKVNVTPVKEGQIKKQNSFTGDMEFQEEAISPKVVGYLLYFRLINGYEKYFYMTEAQCMAHGKKYSASFKKGYGLWVDNFEAMALKTVVKLGLSKYGILSVEMQKAIEVDQSVINEDGSTFFIDNDSQDFEPESQEVKVVSLAEKLKAQQVQEPATVEVKQTEPAKSVEKGPMQTMAGQMKITCLPQYKDMKIRDIKEEELLEILAEADTRADHSSDFRLFYSNACVWLGRKSALN
jgi:recombination protein RecT